MKKTVVLLFLLSAVLICKAQYEEEEEESKANLGFGLGQGYGGFGFRIAGLPDKHIALFAGLGYNLDGLGVNFGGAARLLPGKRVTPTLLAMYGYNGVIFVQGGKQYNKTYYGPTIGAGLEIHKSNGQNFFNIELLIPFRSKAFFDYIDELNQDPNIAEISQPSPVTIGLGYHFKF